LATPSGNRSLGTLGGSYGLLALLGSFPLFLSFVVWRGGSFFDEVRFASPYQNKGRFLIAPQVMAPPLCARDPVVKSVRAPLTFKVPLTKRLPDDIF